MEIQDFDEDDVSALTPAELIAKERAALGAGLNSALRGAGSRKTRVGGSRVPTAGNIAGQESFGLATEFDRDASKDNNPDRPAPLKPVGAQGLAGDLRRLGLEDDSPTEGYGLAMETRAPPGAERQVTEPLSVGGPDVLRTGLDQSSLRAPRLAALPPRRDAAGRDLDASFRGAQAEDADSAPMGGAPLVLAPAPMIQPPPSTAFGLASEVQSRAMGQAQPPGPPGPVLDYSFQGGPQALATSSLPMPPPVQPQLQTQFGALPADIGQLQPPPATSGIAANQVPPIPDVQTGDWPPQQGYGLASDIAASQIGTQPFPDTFSLEQLPADQRWLHLNARQAEQIMLELQKQGAAPRVVDIMDVRDKLLDASAPPRLAYLAAVEQATAEHRLPSNCRPSLLQTKLKAGQNRLLKLLDPVTEPGDQGFVDLSYTPDGALLPETSRVWQFGLSLVRADSVGKTGLQRVRQPCLYIARMALFDRRANRFLGNVLGVRPEAVSQYDKRWEFNPDERVIVRCGCVQSDPQSGTRLVTDDALSVFVEFNVSYRLTVEDTVNLPQSEKRSSQLLDEINTCWAMISFKKCVSLQREVEISVPLYHGSIYDPQPMSAFYAEKRSKTPFRSAFKAKESPVLQFRVGPLSAGKPPLVPYAFMPPTMMATHDLATALAAYRMSMSLLLARQAGPFAAAADPVLAGFPPLLADHHLLSEFLTRWRDLTNKMTAIMDAGCCSPDVLPPLTALVEAFRRCTIELAPLAHCPSIPPRHINNFIEYQGHRLRMVQRYCHVLEPRTNKILGARHPVEPLSHAGFEFLHAPFDVSEVRVCMADRLERPVPFFRH